MERRRARQQGDERAGIDEQSESFHSSIALITAKGI
jgi:hypothetical protein